MYELITKNFCNIILIENIFGERVNLDFTQTQFKIRTVRSPIQAQISYDHKKFVLFVDYWEVEIAGYEHLEAHFKDYDELVHFMKVFNKLKKELFI